eukprot:TRINITY_DN8454_c0_g1_i1.p1 TRINITY_DN8454_c0_g1~~TRINITY_DN8454_c0_g1_i1.p1  ORF type:complete len:223 (+),score=74.03 TRINITY_DN8454_c0_g1_i1:48-671(+)
MHSRFLFHFSLICLFISLTICYTPFIPFVYPTYLQCDPTWSNDTMGGKNPNYDTICIQGCAMTSLAMALSGKGYLIPLTYQNVTPATLNVWLQNNNGYVCINNNCNNLVLDSPERFAPGHITFISEAQKPDLNTLLKWIAESNPVAIAHVRKNSHFVLLVGYDLINPTRIFVNDPYYKTPIYEYDDISDIILYKIDNLQPNSKQSKV